MREGQNLMQGVAATCWDKGNMEQEISRKTGLSDGQLKEKESRLSVWQKKVLSRLLDKYEQSRAYAGENKVS